MLVMNSDGSLSVLSELADLDEYERLMWSEDEARKAALESGEGIGLPLDGEGEGEEGDELPFD